MAKPLDDTFFQAFIFERGELIPCEHIDNWREKGLEKHHFIKQQHYRRNPEWFIARRIEQKVIYLLQAWCSPKDKYLHGDIHSALSDEEFFEKYGIEREKLLFNRKRGY